MERSQIALVADLPADASKRPDLRRVIRGPFPVRENRSMSSIPNLNALRTGRGGPRRRGARGGRAVPENDDGPIESERERNDRIVQQTDYDASSSRLSSVALGYLDDPYARAFLRPGEQIAKRYPIINRGTFVRTTAIDVLVTSFLHSSPGQKKQVISLGAGSDTRFWRLCNAQHTTTPIVNYIEIDFQSNVDQKRQVLDRTPALTDRIQPGESSSTTYHIQALDLRTLALDQATDIQSMDPELPTLLLSECCLCYLPPDDAGAVINCFTSKIQGPIALVVYEPTRPFDAFGRTMVSNLASRGIQMQTLKRYHSPEAQRQRLKQAGFIDGQGARDVHQIWSSKSWISDQERERVEKLEWLDEVEEWQLLSSHYCVTWGWRGSLFANAWSDLDGKRTENESRDDEIG